MIKELKFETKSQATYIRRLQKKGKLNVYKGEHGYIAYDTEEYDWHKQHARRGRPIAERDFETYTVKEILNVSKCESCPFARACGHTKEEDKCVMVRLQNILNNLI